MDTNMLFSIIILASIITSSSSLCEVNNVKSNCVYTVKCYTNAGTVSNLGCDTDPYVTFVISNSNLNYLTTGFFASTNFDSRVREIKAINNSWTTIDSSAFRYYSKCIRLDLSNNKITRINAEAFRNLANLQELNLSSNSIESLNLKSFLITENRHTEVRILDLSNNKLQYLRVEINEFTNLEKLYLENNQLTSISDDAFMSLNRLTHLYLEHNLLRSVNLSLIHLKSLTTLNLANNRLTKLSGYEINRLNAIVDFNISHNSLMTVDSNCFIQAYNLQSADFSFNEIKMTIESLMFINSNKLHYLNFYNNNIVGLQENIFAHCDLNYLNLEKNNISGDVKSGTLFNLRHLPKLDLSQQNITGIKNNAFVDMESLLYLNLSRNSINVVENSSFVNVSIIVLDLSYNKVSHLYFLKSCLTNLTELYLNNNNITVIPKYIFENQTEVKKLDLSMNNIIIIEEYSLPLKNLQYLNIFGNRISGTIKQNVFSPAKYLRVLDLSYFNITKIDSLAFVDLPVLAKLKISNNYIQSIDVDNFKRVDNLYSLDISYNNLTELKFNISILPNLKALHLNHNKLTNISGLFSSQCKISYLDLSHNNITNVSDIGNNVLPNLTVLHLNNNKIKHFNNQKINSLTTLIDLGLSSNIISDVKLNYFKELMSVDLSNNNLTYINITFLEKNEYLQALDLSGNKITDLPPGTFQFMKNLKLLNLSSNHLTKLRYGSLKGLHKTEILDLSKNSIKHLDVDIFYECDELKTLIIDYNRIKTFDVERLILVSVKKLRTLSLGGNPILCREIVHNIKSANTTFYAIRQVEVTSIDKIYHEDNVHGIKCGDNPDTITNSTEAPDSSKSNNSNKDDDILSSFTSTAVALIWCSILTLAIIAVGGVAYMKMYKKRILVVNSMDLSGSEFQSDLLS